jgi:hypothetical protein
VAIDEKQEVIALVSFDEYAASADVGRKERVEGDGAEPEVVDRFGERVDAESLHVFGGKRRGGGGRRGRCFRRFGRGGDDVLVEQPFEIGRRFGVRERCRAPQREHRRGSDAAVRATPDHSNTRMSLSTSAVSSTC